MKYKISVFIISVFFSMGSSLLFAAEHQAGDIWTEPYTGMEFVYVPGGCFQMGDVFGDGGSASLPVHEVCLDPFYIGRYEITQGQWRWVMGAGVAALRTRFDASRPLHGEGFNFPMYYLTWNDTQLFISRLASRSSKEFRLPTEAEWEYAARSGGKAEKYAGGLTLDAVAWHKGNSAEAFHPVGKKAPNGLGLYDMTGNVIEWTNDWYDNSYFDRSPRLNPVGADPTKLDKAVRGGSRLRAVRDMSTVARGCLRPDELSAEENGFRLVLPADQVR